MHLVNESFEHTLTWDQPFTLLNFPVISYTINITNLSNGDVTTMMHYNMNDTISQQRLSFISKGDNCYEMDISLVASNEVGDSIATTARVGHPIGEKMYS